MVGMKRSISQMMPENCSILFPRFWYSEESGAWDGDPCGEDDSSKVCWTSWSPRSGLKAVSQECLMRRLWLPKAPVWISLKQTWDTSTQCGLIILLVISGQKNILHLPLPMEPVLCPLRCVDRKVLMNRKEKVTKTTGCRKTKNTCIWEMSNSSSFKSVRIEKAWLVLICSCPKVNTLWTNQLRRRLRLSWNWNHLVSVWRHVLSWF